MNAALPPTPPTLPCPPTPPTPCPDEVSAFQACHSGLDPKSVERSQSQMMTVARKTGNSALVIAIAL
ncbi:hypothetical protein FD724_14565 [Nostoc sp. C057]|uniref:hypothetical protein n=1 Tax=Nostoc sp. C057 TaxID=2576903 RepID=UPI0015C3617D|nr:hypothetical protein [Nostoc sp. C057]QLE49196.1 hypothetical protein FD724_14565 [Nostoc sp. C057]